MPYKGSEKEKKYHREYNQKHKAKILERLKLWKKNNPDKVKEYQRRHYKRSLLST